MRKTTMSEPRARLWRRTAPLLLCLLLLPWFVAEHITYIVTIIFIYSIGIQGQNLLIGYTGQISFGQAGFLAIGAFTFGHLNQWGVFWPLGILAAGLAAGAFGILVGFPSLRLKGPYLAIVTMGFGIAVYQIFVNSEVLSGGRMGLMINQLTPLFNIPFVTFSYYFNFLIALAFTLLSYNIISSYMGRAFIAIRDNDIAAEVIGVNLTRYKLLSFAISSFYAGVAGGLWVSFMNIVTPEHFPISLSIEYLAMVIVGGLGSVLGSIYGAIFMVLVPEILKFGTDPIKNIPAFQHIFAPLREVVFGALIVFFLIFEPRGLAEMWRRVKNFFILWPFAY